MPSRTADRLAREARAALAAAGRSSGAAPATVLLSPAAASFDMFEDYEARGRAFKAAVAALGRGAALMDIAGRLPPPRSPLAAARPAPRDRSPRPGRRRAPLADVILRRERHQADYSILLAVVALAAIGILMVYSSSAMYAYASRDDTLAIVGPQIFWGALGLLVMVGVMRIDYRWLRLVSVPAYLAAIVLLVLVFVPSLGRVVGGSARWLVARAAARGPPGRDREARADRLPRPLDGEQGQADRRVPRRDDPVPAHRAAR